MFKKNESHLQQPLFSTINSLPKKQQKRLAESWAGTFYKEVFSRVEEETFEIMYSDKASRPNIPVNVLFGLEVLKAGYGWTDEEMYEAYCYNVQVRYALGYRNLEEGHFELRTVYNFRRRHTQYMQESGDNLFEACFEQITDEQMEVFKVKSGIQRMDSKQIASNIREMSRLQLLVEVLQRVHRMLKVVDKKKYEEEFERYVKVKSGQYMYRLKGEKHAPHIEQIGRVMTKLVKELEGEYESDATYKMLKRVWQEHFKVVAEEVIVKKGSELSAASMQSPDDMEATYRNKGGEKYVGHVVNVTETADPGNKVQMITKVQVASNNVDDAKLLAEVLPDLVERTGLSQIYTDGGYGSAEVDELCRQNEIEQVQTAIRGMKPEGEKLHLADFEIEQDEAGLPIGITCPGGQQGTIIAGLKLGRYQATFAQEECAGCPLLEQCPTHLKKKKPKRAIYFTLPQMGVASRRRRMKQEKATGKNPRAAIEATVRELSCRLEHGHLRVRGHQRVSMTLLASATMTNLRRIWRYLTHEEKAENAVNDTSATEKQSIKLQNESNNGKISFGDSYFRPRWLLFAHQTDYRLWVAPSCSFSLT